MNPAKKSTNPKKTSSAKKKVETSSSKPPITPQKLAAGLLSGLFILTLVGVSIWADLKSDSVHTASAGTPSSAAYAKISTDSVLRLVFAEPINKASAEQHLVLPEGLEGTVDWEEGSMVFTPSAPLVLGQNYTLSIEEGAVYESGKPVQKPLSFVFAVDGRPKVVSRLPQPESNNIPTDAVIVIAFDRPMVPLTHAYNAQKVQLQNWPVVINPPVEGVWRWLGTTTVEFRPSKPLTQATTYTVSVPSGIQNTIGDTTAEEFTWKFSTIAPKVERSDPSSGFAHAGKDTEIVLTFNLDTDTTALLPYIAFRKVVGEGAGEKKFTLQHGTVEKDGKDIVDTKTVVVIPSQELQMNSKYQLIVGAGAPAAIGKLGTQKDFIVDFSTAGQMVVKNIEKRDYGIAFYFSNPYGKNVKDFITIDPKPSNWDEIEYDTDEWSDNTILNIHPTLDPSTTYTFTLLPELPDAFGQQLGKRVTETITTPDLQPRMFIHSKGQFGIFEKDKPPVFFLNSVNVQQMYVDFAPIQLQNFIALQNAEFPNLGQFAGFKRFSLTHEAAKNDWQVREFDIQKELGTDMKPGLYALAYQSPQYTNYRGEQVVERQLFSLTNLAITLKYTGKKALVWVVDTQTGRPVEGADIAMFDNAAQKVLTGITDPTGFFETDVPLEKFVTSKDYNTSDPTFWVSASKGDDIAYVGSRWDQGVEPYNFGYNDQFDYANESEYRSQVFLYTDRPIYRAGHTISFKGIARLRDTNGVLRPPLSSKRSVLVRVSDANGKEIYKQSHDVSSYGSFHGSITVDEDASLGTYFIEATITPSDDISYQYNTATFEVLAYRKPEYKTDITFSKPDYFSGDFVEATIEGAYYFGAPMEGASVSWRVLSTDYYFNEYTDGWYSFSDNDDQWCWYDGCEQETAFIKEGEDTLDQRGVVDVSFPLKLKEGEVSQVVSIEADITDKNNQVVSNRSSTVVHGSSVYVGIQPDSYGVQPGEKATVKLLTLNPDGSPEPNVSVKLRLYSREWNSIKKKGVDGQYYWDNEVQDTFVSDAKTSTSADGKGIGSIVIPEGGSYKIVAEVEDSKGRIAAASTSIYSYSSAYFNWPRTNSDRLELVADKPEYSVGDIANIIVKSPYQGQGVKALVTVERENIMRKFVLDVKANAVPLEIPITEDMIPNAYVSVVIVKPRQGETFNDNGLDTGVPAFKMGLQKINVESSLKELSVEVVTNKKKYLPRETVEVTLVTKDASGSPVQAEVSLSAVDLSVLALRGYSRPDLVRSFYTTRGLGVRTAHMLLYMLERYKPGSKGGGGDGDATGKRGDFKDTAYWNPTIVTGANGTANVSFTLPDNLTTWKLLAIANTKDSKFGAEDIEIIETKQVIVRPVRPRFAVYKDEIELSAIVHNFLPEKQDFTVSLGGKGFAHMGKSTKNVSIAADGQVKIPFTVKVSSMSGVTLNFVAETKNARDEIEETIPVHMFSAPQSVATSGVLDATSSEMIFAPSKNEATGLTLTATVSPTIATYIPEGLAYTSEYPYGCAEQTMSKLLPNISLKTLQGFEAFSYVKDEELQAKVVEGMSRLYELQHSDGGFQYWLGSNRSSPSLTSYIVYGLQKSKEAGYTVDDKVLARANTYLLEVLRRPPDEDRPWIMSDALRAEILFTLSEGGNTDVQLLNNLWDSRDSLPLYAKAYYVMALQKGGTSSTNNKAEELLKDIKNSAKISPRGVHFEEDNPRAYRWSMNTNTRTTALSLLALLRGDPADPYIPRIVRHLLSVRENGHWDTTQSTSYTLLALVEFLDSTKELDGNFSVDVVSSGVKADTVSFSKENILTQKVVNIDPSTLKRDAISAIEFVKTGEGRLYYDLVMSYVWTSEYMPPAEQGMSISRDIAAVSQDNWKVGDDISLQAGETYKITLNITVPDDRHFVAVESPLPAGFEAIDMSFATSQQYLLDDEITSNQYSNWNDYWWQSMNRFTHTEFRDDQVFLFADYLPTGVYKYEYLVRATVPGTFHQRPARAYEMYFPENFGQTEGFTVDIEDADV